MRRGRAALAAAPWLLAAGLTAAQPGPNPPGVGAFLLPDAPRFRMAAGFAAPTDRYPHGVLGDPVEWGALQAELEQEVAGFVLPERLVFEDIAPRLADVDDIPGPEILVVESDADRGARLAIYRASFPVWLGQPQLRRIAATPFIGRRFRWLAPAGAADLDGDGRVEIATVETPHLGRTLRLWRLQSGRLTELAALPGVTNHRIGDAFISGGLRDCGDGPELVLANTDWTRLLAVRFDGTALIPRDIGPLAGAGSFTAALGCR
jgi:hypothetical protein